jgi:hypothetical protein
MYQIRMIVLAPLMEVIPEKKEIEHEFDLGDIVEWTSSGTTKIGEIVAIVPAGEFPPVLEQMPGYSFRSFGCGNPRKVVSYMIAVTVGKSKIKRLYWPASLWLKRI